MISDTTPRPLAVVTGAAHGVGFELARRFAENGFDLLIVDADPGLREAAQAFETTGAKIYAMALDLSRPASVERLHAQIEALGRPVEALVLHSAAGVSGDFARETDLEDEMNVINLNVTSLVHLTKRVVRDMVNEGHGRILFTSSLAALLPGPFEAVYAASKAFVHSFAEALRNELKDSGVTVTSLMPGMTDTVFVRREGAGHGLLTEAETEDPALIARQGFEALMAGRDHVVAGGLGNKLQGLAAKFMPEAQKATIHKLLTEPSRRRGSTKRSPKGF